MFSPSDLTNDGNNTIYFVDGNGPVNSHKVITEGGVQIFKDIGLTFISWAFKVSELC